MYHNTNLFNHLENVLRYECNPITLSTIDSLICNLKNSDSFLDQKLTDAMKNTQRINQPLRCQINPLNMLKMRPYEVATELLLDLLEDFPVPLVMPSSAFKTFIVDDGPSKTKLDQWILQLLDGPELYHILGLIELPISIRVPLDVCPYRTTTPIDFVIHYFEEKEFKTIPGFIPAHPQIFESLKEYKSNVNPASVLNDEIQPDQYQCTDPTKQDPELLPHHTSIMFSIDESRCIFSYAYSDFDALDTESIIGIPSYNKKYGVWKRTKKLEQPSINFTGLCKKDLQLILVCDAVQQFYQTIRPLYIGEDKPGAFQLLKDWMSYGNSSHQIDQQIYLTNCAIAKALLFSQSHWPYHVHGPFTLNDIVLPNKQPTWPYIRLYFGQLRRTYRTLEAIPQSEKSMLYSHFIQSLETELEPHPRLDTPTVFFTPQCVNLSCLFANMYNLLEKHGLSRAFVPLFEGILLGQISSYYLLKPEYMEASVKTISVDNPPYEYVNIKPKYLKETAYPVMWMLTNPKPEVVDAFMNVLYDVVYCLATQITDWKSGLFVTPAFTDEKSIWICDPRTDQMNLHPNFD